MKLQKDERETIIRFCDASDICEIYTASKPIINKLNKLCIESPNDYKSLYIDEEFTTYQTSKKLITFRKQKQLTAEQRKTASERMKNMHKKEPR